MEFVTWGMLAIAFGVLSLIEIAVRVGSLPWPWKPSWRSIGLSLFATFCAAMAHNPPWGVVVEPMVWVGVVVVSVVMWTLVLRHKRQANSNT